MIDDFIGVLQEKGLLLKDEELDPLNEAQSVLQDEDIADALWLAVQMGGEPAPTAPRSPAELESSETSSTLQIEDVEGEGNPPPRPEMPVASAYVQNADTMASETEVPETGLPLQVQAAPALPNAHGMGQALRPLMRKAPSRVQQVLDEQATVDRIAQEDIWMPVLQAAPERWFDLELVIELSPFSFVWESTLSEFQRLLELQGAFRHIRTWLVEGADSSTPKLLPKPQGKFLSQPQQTASIGRVSRSPRELIDASGRALVLYVSDCRSQLWKQGKIHGWLQLWGKHEPTAIAQLLPEQLWQQTSLNAGFKVQVSAFTPGVANSKLQVHNVPSRRPIPEPIALTIPVVTLTANALQQWAKVVTAGGQQRLPARLFDLDRIQRNRTQVASDSAVIEPQTSEARVELFEATASSAAIRLARLMSVVPVELPVVHLIQQTLFKSDADPVHVAEVYASCLIETRKTDENGTERYDFVPGIRRLLNQVTPVDETLDVLDVISQEIARTLGFEIKSFTALLAPDLDWDETKKAAILPFAQIATEVLSRLGGQYEALARQVEQEARQHKDWIQPPEAELEPDPQFPELSALPFTKAELIDAKDELTDEAEPDISLVVDEFDIATISVEAEPETEDDTVEQFEFTVATLVRREHGWVIQRQPRSAYRFIEVLSDGAAEPGFFQGIARRLGFQNNSSVSDDRSAALDLELVAIQGGTFTMGSPANESDRRRNESPQHEVTLQPFFMGRYPVTQAQWGFVASLEQVNRELEPDPSRFKGERRPVEQVSWYDAVEFCARLSRHTNRTYRLPSEVEWEYACRAGTETPFHFGETISSELANYRGTRTYAGGPKGEFREETTPVDHFSMANGFGLSDMHGNVLEWCQDQYHGSYEGAPTDGSAWLSKNERASRIRRGGSWFLNPGDCRSAYRNFLDPDYRDVSFGFRVVCVAPFA